MRHPDSDAWRGLFESAAHWAMLAMATLALCLFLLAGCPSMQLAGQDADDWRADMLRRHNNRRARNGLPRLDMQGQCNRAAQGHAEMMAVVGRMEHVLFGQDAGDRLRRAGYDWSRWGENIAVGWELPGDVMSAWMHSPDHRANILSSWSNHVGFGYAEDDRGHPYWCVVIARPR